MEMVQDLVDAQSLTEIMLALENRLYKNKRWRNKEPTKADRILEKINNDFE